MTYYYAIESTLLWNGIRSNGNTIELMQQFVNDYPHVRLYIYSIHDFNKKCSSEYVAKFGQPTERFSARTIEVDLIPYPFDTYVYERIPFELFNMLRNRVGTKTPLSKEFSIAVLEFDDQNDEVMWGLTNS